MYDPAIGRFQTIDPLGEKYLSYSLYNYVLNNPLKYVDPVGADVWIYFYASEDSETGAGHVAIGVGTAKKQKYYSFYPKGDKDEQQSIKGKELSFNEALSVDNEEDLQEAQPILALRVKTTKEQDNAAIENLENTMKNGDNDWTLGNNCADACKGALSKIGVDGGKQGISTPKEIVEDLLESKKNKPLFENRTIQTVKGNLQNYYKEGNGVSYEQTERALLANPNIPTAAKVMILKDRQKVYKDSEKVNTQNLTN